MKPCLFLPLVLVPPFSLALAEDAVFEPGAEPVLVLEEGAGEGPAWHPSHGLFFSGGDGITLMKPDGDTSLFLHKAGSNGLLWDAQGRLLVCQPAFRRVSRLNPETKALTVLSSKYSSKLYNQPNDITVDGSGRIYFSDPRYGSRDGMEIVDSEGRKIEGVYRIDPDRTVTRIITHEVDRPNGLLVTPDDQHLYVADNNNSEGGARKLWRFDLKPDGTVDISSQTLIFDWQTGRGPDGMVMDVNGRLYVAGGLNKPNPPHETADKFKGGIYVFAPTGEQEAFVPIPRDEVTNCTFGGADLQTLYITAGGTLWSIRTTAPGKMPWPK